MSQANVEAAERIYAARLRGDLDALLAEHHRLFDRSHGSDSHPGLRRWFGEAPRQAH